MIDARLTAALLAVVLTGGCSSKAKPVGDVVAIVNGHDVTVGDLEAEARARGINFDAKGGDAARAAVLRFVVSRAMLVDAATTAHLDNNPKLLAERRRVDANLLAQVQVSKWMAEAPPVTPGQIAAYRAANPQIFAGRQILTVDQVQATPNGPLPAGGRDTAADLMEQLASLGVANKASRVEVDSATLPKAIVDAMTAHPTVPARIDNGPTVTFLTLVSSRPNPAPEDMQRQFAIRTLQGQWLDKRIEAAVAKLRQDNHIVYQPGYAPK